MLCALTKPKPDARTDFGAMFPVIVLTNLIFFSAMVTELETSSEFAGAMLVPTKANRNSCEGEHPISNTKMCWMKVHEHTLCERVEYARQL